MKRWEADRLAVEERAKITRRTWEKEDYVYWDKTHGYFCNKNKSHWDSSLKLIDGWEIFEEPKPIEAPLWLMQRDNDLTLEEIIFEINENRKCLKQIVDKINEMCKT